MDHYNRGLEKSIGQFDQTHILKFSTLYDLPFGKGQKWLNQRYPEPCARRLARGGHPGLLERLSHRVDAQQPAADLQRHHAPGRRFLRRLARDRSPAKSSTPTWTASSSRPISSRRSRRTCSAMPRDTTPRFAPSGTSRRTSAWPRHSRSPKRSRRSARRGVQPLQPHDI